MTDTYSAAERFELQTRLRAGEPLRCPACGSDVARQPVQRPPGVSYVRRRELLICTGCRRSAALDLPPPPP